MLYFVVMRVMCHDMAHTCHVCVSHIYIMFHVLLFMSHVPSIISCLMDDCLLVMCVLPYLQYDRISSYLTLRSEYYSMEKQLDQLWSQRDVMKEHADWAKARHGAYMWCHRMQHVSYAVSCSMSHLLMCSCGHDVMWVNPCYNM